MTFNRDGSKSRMTKYCPVLSYILKATQPDTFLALNFDHTYQNQSCCKNPSMISTHCRARTPTQFAFPWA